MCLKIGAVRQGLGSPRQMTESMSLGRTLARFYGRGLRARNAFLTVLDPEEKEYRTIQHTIAVDIRV